MPGQKTVSLEEFRKLPKAHKYRARAEVVDGIRFPSKREAQRYRELKLLEYAQRITGLRCHVMFPLEVNGHLVCKYEADFCYIEDGHEITEDAKGFRTDVYKLKAKLMLAIYGIKIRET